MAGHSIRERKEKISSLSSKAAREGRIRKEATNKFTEDIKGFTLLSAKENKRRAQIAGKIAVMRDAADRRKRK